MSLEQWETYYRGGLVATGPAGADGLYDLEVRSAWVSFFDRLPERARVLDIGTGNGVIPLMACAHAKARKLDWQVDATDLARIDPFRDVPDAAARFEGVSFHAEVANERLPFSGATFDAACAHYAIEYGDTEASLIELARVLKPFGLAQCVLHHSDSLLLQSARRSIEECELVFKKTRLYRRVHRLVTLESPNPQVLEHAQRELSGAIRQLREALDRARSQHPAAGRILAVALDAARALLASRQHHRGTQVGLEVDRAEFELRTAWRRLKDLVDHSVDEARMRAIEAQAVSAGFEISGRELLHHNGNNLVGWLLKLQRR